MIYCSGDETANSFCCCLSLHLNITQLCAQSCLVQLLIFSFLLHAFAPGNIKVVLLCLNVLYQ